MVLQPVYAVARALSLPAAVTVVNEFALKKGIHIVEDIMMDYPVAKLSRDDLSHDRAAHQETDTRPHRIGAVDDSTRQLVDLLYDIHLTADAAAGIGFVPDRLPVGTPQVGHQILIHRIILYHII